ncbi:transcriptional regulator [bacterium 210820-DFI.6.52]|nr:transcriptional regulator [bacterium 210820-DFI.6.52]
MGNLVALSDYFGVSLDELVKGEKQLQSSPPPADDVGPFPHRFQWEYKSKQTLFGLPLVHIHLGWGLCRAKGILAIGNLATGLFSLGALSAGLFSLGGLSLGLLALGGLALGGLALGGVAIGLLAIGGLAVGVVSLGGLSIGVYAVGGAALADRVAIGEFASGHIALGERARGSLAYSRVTCTPDLLRRMILDEYPHTWKALVDFLTLFLE